MLRLNNRTKIVKSTPFFESYRKKKRTLEFKLRAGKFDLGKQQKVRLARVKERVRDLVLSMK